MRHFLVQHGDAVAKEIDPDRPLSERGRNDVRQVASFLGTAGVHVSTILHSGKARAEQTARLLAEFLRPVGVDMRVEQVSGIDPLDPTEGFARRIEEWAQDTMVVGHLPFMGKLASRLVTDDETVSTVSFKTGTIVCVERGEETGWSVSWMICPELGTGDVGTIPGPAYRS